MNKKVIGLDFGSDSCRALLVDAESGEELASSSFAYSRWSEGQYCEASNQQFRQHPLDYIEATEKTILGIFEQYPEYAKDVLAIGIDTTGSTVCPVDASGTPLALTEDFSDNPNAMFFLWKDHTAIKEAEEINDLAARWDGPDFTRYVGGKYSSEWFWAKILKGLRDDPSIREDAYSWVEHCDWLPALLTGVNDVHQVRRSRCAAGHKAMWHKDWGGLPGDDFWVSLDPLLAGLRDRLYTETFTSDQAAGTLSAEWAKRLGLSEDVKVGVGALDAHMGAVGGEIEDYSLCKIMGTSTCDILVAPNSEAKNIYVDGICGQVDGSVLPGSLGLEAGQSAFGDVYAWFKELLLWPLENNSAISKEQVDEIGDKLIENLSIAAEKLSVGQSGVVALDWLNGRRTPDVNPRVKAAIQGIRLGTDAASIFRALVEATAFGSKAIIDRFVENGIRVHSVYALGGVAKKSKLVMQICADVLNIPIKVVRSSEACALGASMFAAVIAGVYPDIQSAMKKMGSGVEQVYQPGKENVEKYKKLYADYLNLSRHSENLIREEKTTGVLV